MDLNKKVKDWLNENLVPVNYADWSNLIKTPRPDRIGCVFTGDPEKLLSDFVAAIVAETTAEDAAIITAQMASFNPRFSLPGSDTVAYILREAILHPDRRLTSPATGPTEAQFYVNAAYVADMQAAHAALDKAGVPKTQYREMAEMPGETPATRVSSPNKPLTMAERVEWLVKRLNNQAGQLYIMDFTRREVAEDCAKIAFYFTGGGQIVDAIRAKYGLQSSTIVESSKSVAVAVDTTATIGHQIATRHAMGIINNLTHIGEDHHEQQCAAEIDAAVEQARKETDLAWMRRSSEALRGLRMVMLNQFPEPRPHLGFNEFTEGFNDALRKCVAVVEVRTSPDTKIPSISDNRTKTESLLRAKIFSQLPDHKNESGGSERDYGYNTALYECRLIVLGKPETAAREVVNKKDYGLSQEVEDWLHFKYGRQAALEYARGMQGHPDGSNQNPVTP